MKKIISIIITLAMLLSMTTVIAEEEIKVYVDGEQVVFDAQPFIENDRTLVPMRAIFEKLGAWVYWDESSQVVLAEKGNVGIQISIGNSAMSKNIYSAGNFPEYEGEVLPDGLGFTTESIELDVPAKIVNDRTFIPLRAVSEAFDCVVQWDGDARTVTITSKKTNAISTGYEKLQPAKEDGTYLQKLMSSLPEDKNSVVSPLSLKLSMAMLANGATDKTKEEILNAFGIKNIKEYNEYVKNTISDMNKYEESGEVTVANSIWFNQDFYKNPKSGFSTKFQETIAEYYNGTAEIVENKNSVEKVNEWINEKTNGKIPVLLGDSDREFLISIINTIYLRTKWNSPFDKEETKKDIFVDINGNENEIEFMNRTTGSGDYYEDDKMQMIKLQYQNYMSMYIVLGDDTEFENNIEKIERKKVKMSIPKFDITYSADMAEVLKGLGIKKAFENNNYDFRTMVNNIPEEIKIEKVLQKTIINVDEEGTEAATVTDVGLAGASRPKDEKIYEFKANRPFSYYIVDDWSDEILFAGRYVKCE